MPRPLHGDERAVARRTAVKQLATAGAVAWTAPAVLSSRALAQSEACTPKCIPQISGTPTATASASCTGAGNGRRITVTVILTGDVAATCPCDGDGPATLGTPTVTSTAGNASIEGNVVTVPIGRSAIGFSVTVSVQASCDDLDDTTCAVTCRTTIPISVTEQDEGNCRNIGATVGNITSGCS